jgi:hypothetical protein
MSATQTPPRFVIGLRDLDQLLLPPKLSCVPSSVKVANETATAAVNAATTANMEMRAAQTETKRAVSIDASADAKQSPQASHSRRVQGSLHDVKFTAPVQPTNQHIVGIRELIDPIERDPVRNSAPTSRRTLGEK